VTPPDPVFNFNVMHDAGPSPRVTT
jgi:hypothetical protein